jgi:uncharacterized protein
MSLSNLFRKSVYGVALAVALSGAALAQSANISPEHLALARAVIDFTGANKSFDNVIPQLIQEARNLVLTTNPQVKNDLDAIIPGLQEELGKNQEELLNSISRVYATKFTEDELKEIAAFYESPVGKKLTAATPDMLRESLGEMREWAQKMSALVMTRIRDELAKKGHAI